LRQDSRIDANDANKFSEVAQMTVSAKFKVILVSVSAAMLVAGASAMAQELQGLQAKSGPRLDFPAGLATDGHAVYVSNSRNNTIEAIDAASKSLRIVAGKLFQQGSNDGTGDSARFNSPDGMAISGQDLYLCDTDNSDIRKVNIGSGTVTTIAGTANIGGTEDGTGSAAHFNLPTQIATDGTSLYVADSGNNSIRRITLADMKVKTIAGQPGAAGKTEGNPGKSQFSGPRGIAVDKKAIYVADTGNEVIRKIDISTLETSTIAGTGAEGDKDGPALEAQFNNPGAICTDGTMLYVLDADNHSIRKIDLTANTVTKLTLVNGHIGSGCALTSDGKQLYFSDTTENAVEVVDTTSGNFTTLYPPGQ
jgi:DNA-binding beta-propeller fold protein YncE